LVAINVRESNIQNIDMYMKITKQLLAIQETHLKFSKSSSAKSCRCFFNC
jgi:hypothetical protein